MAQDSPRREFLKTAGNAALATSLFTGNLRGANDKPTIAFIGCGRMGSDNIDFAARTGGVEIVGVCDVYQPALERAEARVRRLGFTSVKTYRDFREILAGKDVWCEKPACVYVEEGLKMVEAARKYKRVVQAGTMQRSGGFFQKAREIVRSGQLGDITFCNTFQAGTTSREGYGYPPDSDPPPGLDWDLWLGPAPKRPFNANRWGVGPDRWSTFRYFWDYAGGAMTDWGVHLLDKFYVKDNLETPDTMLATFRYPGFLGAYESRTANPFPFYTSTYGTAFHGTEATLMVNREGFETCVRTTTTTCLLANLALRHGATPAWDQQAFTVKQREIKPFLKARYRSPWKLEV